MGSGTSLMMVLGIALIIAGVVVILIGAVTENISIDGFSFSDPYLIFGFLFIGIGVILVIISPFFDG